MGATVRKTRRHDLAATTRRLRRLVLWVIVSLSVFVLLGVAVSLLWPHQWNPLLVSLVLNVIAGLIGASVAILTAIFVVQKFLDDRALEMEAETARYRALWTE